MKIRTGFVSNSSSSSFIIHKNAIGEETFKLILETVIKAFIQEKEVEGISYPAWGDNMETYNLQGDYILVETHNAPDNVQELLSRYKDKAYVIYG